MIDPDYVNRDTAELPTAMPATIENLRKMVENSDYIDAAIERIALVLSDEILNYRKGGQYHERYRKRGK
jgi:hypothetical protein